jgi:hypothetical protein
MNTPVQKLRQRLFLLLAATVACSAFTACHDDDRDHHVRHGYRHDDDRRVVVSHDDYRHDGYRRDGYYGGTVRDTSVTVRREAPVVRERSVSYERY